MAAGAKKVSVSFVALSAARGIPRAALTRAAHLILSSSYELSVVFTNSAHSQQLNKKFRRKNYPANVLSFPLSSSSGEIFLDIKKISKEAKDFGLSGKNAVIYMFIHALLHLKGRKHGATMDAEERRTLEKLKIPMPFHLNQHTHGKKHRRRH